MDMRLSREHRELAARAKHFCSQVLQPRELEVEENGGLPEASRPALRDAVREWGFGAINHVERDGGGGYTIFEQTLINEQLGRATNGLWTVAWQPAICLKHGTDKQKNEYLRAACRGERRGCYAITEPGAGSDPRLHQQHPALTAQPSSAKQ